MMRVFSFADRGRDFIYGTINAWMGNIPSEANENVLTLHHSVLEPRRKKRGVGEMGCSRCEGPVLAARWTRRG